MEKISSLNEINNELTVVYETLLQYQVQIRWAIRSIIGCLFTILILVGICSYSIISSQTSLSGEFLASSGAGLSSAFGYRILLTLVLFFTLLLIFIIILLFRKYVHLKTSANLIHDQITALKKELMGV